MLETKHDQEWTQQELFHSKRYRVHQKVNGVKVNGGPRRAHGLNDLVPIDDPWPLNLREEKKAMRFFLPGPKL